jgi:hypothetical protein
MSVSPADGEPLARPVGVLFEAAELSLLRLLSRALAQGIDSPRWAEVWARGLAALRRSVARVLTRLRGPADTAVRTAVTSAYALGEQAALASIAHFPAPLRSAAPVAPRPGAADWHAQVTAGRIVPLYGGIDRAVADAYLSIAGTVAASAGSDRRAVLERHLAVYAGAGIGGFTDPHDRVWGMATYAEMTVRTAAGSAALDGYLDTIRPVPEALVQVSASAIECPKCEPWEGQILSLADISGARELVLPGPGGRGHEITVAGSVSEARAAGLCHPNCRHTLTTYLPGVTRPPVRPDAGGATYADTQRQRYLERQARRWTRVAAAAPSEDARRAANVRASHYQTRIGQLTDATGLERHRERERVSAPH